MSADCAAAFGDMFYPAPACLLESSHHRVQHDSRSTPSRASTQELAQAESISRSIYVCTIATSAKRTPPTSRRAPGRSPGTRRIAVAVPSTCSNTLVRRERPQRLKVPSGTIKVADHELPKCTTSICKNHRRRHQICTQALRNSCRQNLRNATVATHAHLPGIVRHCSV